MLVDYYEVLSRAIASLEDNTAEVRRAVYDRARQMLAERLAQTSPPPTPTQLRAEEIAFDDAARRVEAEYAQIGLDDTPSPEHVAPAADNAPPDDATELLATAPRRSRSFVLISALTAVLIIAIFSIGYFAATSGLFKPGSKTPAKSVVATPHRTAAVSDVPIEDPDPGFDGGSSDPHLPFFYRRQPVYYRTNHPYHTIVIDKSQRFLYLIQSKTVALRYGVAMGEECSAQRGLHQVAQKREWPAWQPSEPVKRARSVPADMAGGPGNPLGARALDLDSTADRIHGTNAPSTIGREMLFGCVRLTNDDIVDLYKRVAIGARVLITN
jgi:lipoprotein-anchoring transpeptidase ErfK/SrfK